MQADLIVFWVFAPISVASAIGMLVMRNAVHSLLFLVVNFVTIAVFYLTLGAEFLAVIQITVYAGAILVLFLFVIMLLGVDREEDLSDRLIAQRPVAIMLGVAFAAETFFAIRAGVGLSKHAPPGFDVANRDGNTQALARVLFGPYFFPFEVTSILLIIAAVAAMVLAHRRSRAITQAEIEARASLGELEAAR